MIKLLILDFDGTLADTQELIVCTNQEAMRRLGYPVRDAQTIIDTIGLPLEKGILTMFPDLPPEVLPQWVKVYRTVFDELKEHIGPQLFPGVKETLKQLHADGHLISVASSRLSISLNAFLEDLGLMPYICYVLGADNVSKAKPDPEPVLKTLRDLQIPAREALVVGDMPVDIQMGLGADAFTCGVSYGNSNREALKKAGAHRVVDLFSEIPQLLNSF